MANLTYLVILLYTHSLFISHMWLCFQNVIQVTPVTEALLGGVHAPCSLRYFTPFSLLPSILWRSLLFAHFHCSFFISLCIPLLFNFSSCSLIISLAPCSIFNFLLLPASFSKFLCSLLPDYVSLASCSLPYFRPCSLLPWVSRAILPAPWLPLTGVQGWKRSLKLYLIWRESTLHHLYPFQVALSSWNWVPNTLKSLALWGQSPVVCCNYKRPLFPLSLIYFTFLLSTIYKYTKVMRLFYDNVIIVHTVVNLQRGTLSAPLFGKLIPELTAPPPTTKGENLKFGAPP